MPRIRSSDRTYWFIAFLPRAVMPMAVRGLRPTNRFLAFDVTDFLKFLQMRAERAVGRLQHASERREIPGSLRLQRGQHAQAYRSVNGR
ncbi:hypothetical protein LCGC14_2866310, partial [marine sediment metagenome]